MRYYVEFDPRDFEFWGGAKERMDSATDQQREEVVCMAYLIVEHGGFVSCCSFTDEDVKALLNKMYGRMGPRQQIRRVVLCITI